MADDSKKKEKENLWIKLVSVLAGSGILAAIIGFALPRIFAENRPPTAVITVNEKKGEAPLEIFAGGLKSSDPEGKKLAFEWSIDGEPTSSESSFEKTFRTSGLKKIVLTVTDPNGLKGEDIETIEVLEPEEREKPTLILDVFSEQKPDDPQRTYYEKVSGEGKFLIRPVDKYLSTIYSGGTIEPLPLYSHPWRNLSFPSLDIKLVNNTSKTILLYEVVFQVKRSWLDERPLPIIKGTGYNMTFPLRNIGWGPMYDTVVNFALVDSKESMEVIREHPHKIDAGDIVEYLRENSLASFFEIEGVDISLFDFSRKERVSDEMIRKAYGPFSSGKAWMIGNLHYRSREKSGKMQERVNKFIELVAFGSSGVGVSLPPEKEYNVKLKVSGKDYRVRVPISQVIEPDKTDRFTIKIAADKSSFHEFKLYFRYNDQDEIITNPIELDLFLPRCAAVRLMENEREITHLNGNMSKQ